jgi:hypothetical protein
MTLRALLAIALVLSTMLFGAARAESRTAVFGVSKSAPPVPRVECPRPLMLHLARFEDGSARLECAHRVLVRVSVPG